MWFIVPDALERSSVHSWFVIHATNATRCTSPLDTIMLVIAELVSTICLALVTRCMLALFQLRLPNACTEGDMNPTRSKVPHQHLRNGMQKIPRKYPDSGVPASSPVTHLVTISYHHTAVTNNLARSYQHDTRCVHQKVTGLKDGVWYRNRTHDP